jgi:hypothetical protein
MDTCFLSTHLVEFGTLVMGTLAAAAHPARSAFVTAAQYVWSTLAKIG